MLKKLNIVLVILLCLFLPISAFAVTYVNTGPTTENTGDVGVPTGSSYYINDVIQVLVNKWDATDTPKVTNDIDEGFTPGSVWIDVTHDANYVCVDNTDGAAIWVGHSGIELVRAGEAIAKGQAVYISGALGAARPIVSLIDADDPTKIRMIGLAREDIANGADGFISTSGQINDVDTEGATDCNPNDEDWTAGDPLFVMLDGSGGLTNVRPTSGRVIMAAITQLGDHNTDTLYVLGHIGRVDMAAAVGEGIRLRLGAADASTKITIKDYADVEVASIDDDGKADFTSLTLDTALADAEVSDTLTASILAAGADADMNNLDIVEVKTVQFNGVYAIGNSGSTETIDWQNGAYQSITIDEACVISFSNEYVGTLNLIVTYGGSFALTFDVGVTLLEEGGVEIVTTDAAGSDLLIFKNLGVADTYVMGGLLDYKD